MLAENDARRILYREGLDLGPIRATLLDVEAELASGKRADFLFELEWEGQTRRFAAEYKRDSTPKTIDAAIPQARAIVAGVPDLFPVVVAPYLGEESLRRFLQEKISGVDLCGNAVVIVPGQWLIVLSGKPNRYPSSAPIKAIYSGTSSLVGRVLFSRPTFDRVTEVQTEILARGGEVSLGTVSKVLKGLDEDLILTRQPQIKLVRADRLLDRLQENYDTPEIRRREEGKLELTPQVYASLAANARARGARILGRSESRYVVSASTEVRTFYTTSIDAVLQDLPFRAGPRFANVEFAETDDQRVYFDAREAEGFPWASPLQLYLELASGGKRERETAEQLREDLIHFRYV